MVKNDSGWLPVFVAIFSPSLVEIRSDGGLVVFLVFEEERVALTHHLPVDDGESCVFGSASFGIGRLIVVESTSRIDPLYSLAFLKENDHASNNGDNSNR
jgi:hypothetical protein